MKNETQGNELLQVVDDLDSRTTIIEEQIDEFKAKITSFAAKEGPPGKPGEPGKSVVGPPGRAGKTPTKAELEALIKPLIPDPIPGKAGETKILHDYGGGGNANRQIRVEGIDVLKTYTDINIFGVTASVVATVDNVNKRVNIGVQGGTSSLVGFASIGGTIIGGRAKDVLFVYPASVFAQADNLQFDPVAQQLQIGPSAGFDGNSEIELSMSNNINNFSGVYNQNKSAGNTASTDFIAGADNDGVSETGHFIDVGIQSSGYVGATSGVIKAISLNNGGTGYIANDTLTISTGNADATITVLTVNGSGVILTIALALSGTGYAVGNGKATSGGAGSGAQINILSLIDSTLFIADDAYSYASGGNLLIGIDGGVVGKAIKFFVDGTGIANEVARMTSSVLQLGNTGSVAGQIYFKGKTSGTTLLQAPSVAGAFTLVLPPTAGSANQVLTTDGAGVTTWASVAAGGSGITRVTSIISVSSTIAAVAKTDYVVLANVGLTATLPTAIGNNNLYTVKNISASSVLVTTSLGETIDGSASALMNVQNLSLDFISNASVWQVV